MAKRESLKYRSLLKTNDLLFKSVVVGSLTYSERNTFGLFSETQKELKQIRGFLLMDQLLPSYTCCSLNDSTNRTCFLVDLG